MEMFAMNVSTPQLQPFNTSGHGCSTSLISIYMKLVYNLFYFAVIFPLSAVVLCLGWRRWRQQRSTSAAVPHSDFFTYNMAAVELVGVVGAAVGVYSRFVNLPATEKVAKYISTFPWNAQLLFPILICADRYLAVVRPISYLKLRQARGTRIRNMITVAVWLLCSVMIRGTALFSQYIQLHLLPACLMGFGLLSITFCSLSVLCVLIRQPAGKTQVDQTKRRAFRIIMIIMGVLNLRFGVNMICYAVSAVPASSLGVLCVVEVTSYCSNLPSSMVLPVLFLHRSCKNTKTLTQK